MRRARWLTMEQAARRLGVSRSTLFRMLDRGAVISVRKGRRRLISEPSVKAALRPLEPQFPAFTRSHALFKLVGRYRSRGPGPGSSDKHRYLGGA